MNRLTALEWPVKPGNPGELSSELLWVAVLDLTQGLPTVLARCQTFADPEGFHLSVLALAEVVRAIGYADAPRQPEQGE